MQDQIQEIFINVTDENGCVGISNFYLEIDCITNNESLTNIVFPKFITPNNDGYNDTWDIRGINNFPTATILVFDIQGQVIFQHNNADGDYQPWNARYLNGQIIISADYYYQIILDSDNPNINNTKTGSVIIVY